MIPGSKRVGHIQTPETLMPGPYPVSGMFVEAYPTNRYDIVIGVTGLRGAEDNEAGLRLRPGDRAQLSAMELDLGKIKLAVNQANDGVFWVSW